MRRGRTLRDDGLVVVGSARQAELRFGQYVPAGMASATLLSPVIPTETGGMEMNKMGGVTPSPWSGASDRRDGHGRPSASPSGRRSSKRVNGDRLGAAAKGARSKIKGK